MIVECAAQSCAGRIGLHQRSVDDRDLVRHAIAFAAMPFEALDLPQCILAPTCPRIGQSVVAQYRDIRIAQRQLLQRAFDVAGLDLIDAESFDHSQGVFDIPQLRGIARTAPYFHNNSAATLEDVLTFYQALFARREVLAPSSAFINAPFGPFSPQETPALLA